MKTLSRRDLCVVLPAMAALPAALAAQAHTSEFPAPQGAPPAAHTVPANDRPDAQLASGGTVGPARAIPFEAMPAKTNAAGGETRQIAQGSLATGETVNLHESMQVVGQAPPALHVIQHSEFILVREGELEFEHEVDGRVVNERIGPGGVFYVAFGTKHAIKNVGTVPAKYFVVGIGGDAK
ncbi:MAG: cupin domain-containing protein [Acidobacteriota bacterium]|nr:cupin domain-containing protein [Acidobacteriota bacterium]